MRPRMLGDIAIAYETTRKEADEERKPFRSSPQPSRGARFSASDRLRSRGTTPTPKRWKAFERDILAQLGIPDPYADRERVELTCRTPTRPTTIRAIRAISPPWWQEGEGAAPPPPTTGWWRAIRHFVRVEGWIGCETICRVVPRRPRSRTRWAFPRIEGAPCCATSSACMNGASPTSMVHRADIVAVKREHSARRTDEPVRGAPRIRAWWSITKTLDDPEGMVHIPRPRPPS